jgi:EmrB/QacA subfamily drug resistance transporter
MTSSQSVAAPGARSSRTPLLLACGGSFLAFLDVTITNLAVPDLAGDFSVGVTSLSWVVTLYTILFAALLAPAGRLADIVGRRRLFVAGVTTFTAASLIAAIAPTFGVLLAARAVQGVGAALMMPASLAFVLADTPPEKRPAAIGMWSASASVAAAAGPALGGVLVDTLDWRALFCINVPIGAWLSWRAWRLPATAAAESRGRLPDLVGTALIAGAVGLLVLGVTEGPTWGWGSVATIASLAVAVALGLLALLRSARHARPALEIGLWSNRTYASANVVSLLFGVGLYASLLLGVLYLVDVWGYSELQAGLAMTPGAVFAAAVGIAIGRSVRKPSPSVLVFAGGLTIAATSAALALWLPAEPHFLTAWLPGGFGLGVGMGAVSVGVSSAAALSVGPQRFAAATGLNIAARQVGGALGVALLAVILDGRTPADGAGPFLSVYWLMAGVCVAAAVVGLRLVLPPVAAAPPRATAAPARVAATAGGR